MSHGLFSSRGHLSVDIRYRGPQLVYGNCQGCYNSDIGMYLDAPNGEGFTFSYMFGETLNNGVVFTGAINNISNSLISRGIYLQPYGEAYIVGTGWVSFQTPTIKTKDVGNIYSGARTIYP